MSDMEHESGPFPSQAQAAADVMSRMVPGNEIVIHQDGCTGGWDVCICTPETYVMADDRTLIPLISDKDGVA